MAERHARRRAGHQYGPDQMFRFVRLVLLRDETYDTAAREAFHVPFAKADRTCAAWVRGQAR